MAIRRDLLRNSHGFAQVVANSLRDQLVCAQPLKAATILCFPMGSHFALATCSSRPAIQVAAAALRDAYSVKRVKDVSSLDCVIVMRQSGGRAALGTKSSAA